MTDSPEIRLNPAVIPLSIYLHWPWCVRKCPYCDFNSHGAPKELGALEALEGAYVDPGRSKPGSSKHFARRA